MRFAKIVVACISVAFFSCTALAWDGYDYDKGNYVEIDRGNLVRPGNDIEIYDYETGQYHDVTVDSIHKYGSDVEIEVYDNTTGDYRTLNMDSN